MEILTIAILGISVVGLYLLIHSLYNFLNMNWTTRSPLREVPVGPLRRAINKSAYITYPTLYLRYFWSNYLHPLPKKIHYYPAISMGVVSVSATLSVAIYTNSEMIVIITVFYASIIFMSQFLGKPRPDLNLTISTRTGDEGYKTTISLRNSGEKDMNNMFVYFRFYDRYGRELTPWRITQKNFDQLLTNIESGESIEDIPIDLYSIPGTDLEIHEGEKYTVLSDVEARTPLILHVKCKPEARYRHLGLNVMSPMSYGTPS